MEKSKIFFYGVGFGYRSDVVTFFLKVLKLPINIKSVEKNKEKYGQIENIFLRRWVWISVRSHITLNIVATMPRYCFAIFTIFLNIPYRFINTYATLRQYCWTPMISVFQYYFNICTRFSNAREMLEMYN